MELYDLAAEETTDQMIKLFRGASLAVELAHLPHEPAWVEQAARRGTS